MTYRNITKADVDAAEPLEFGGQGVRTVADDTYKRQKRSVTVQLFYHGAPVSFGYAPEDDVQIHDIEQRIDTLLKREGWTGAPQPAASVAGNGKRKATYVDPEYDRNGDPICPVHGKVLKQGDYGLYCSAKAKEGEEANAKGYCALKFKE